MLKSHILCVLFTVCGLSFALATLSGEVAEILRRGGRFFPCMWQVQPGICKDLTGEQKEYATIAGERISAVKLLLDQLFEFARIEADELKLNCRNTDIHSVLRDVVASYYGDFEQKKCVPYIVIPNPPAIIWGDPDALTRIFSNVVYNALVHGEGNYQITAAIEEAQTVITIKNASSSIQQEDIPHLFDRFYTTDQSRTKKTTGLGLAIAQRLVTRMGGQIVASLQNGIFAIQVVFPIVNS